MDAAILPLTATLIDPVVRRKYGLCKKHNQLADPQGPRWLKRRPIQGSYLPPLLPFTCFTISLLIASVVSEFR